VRFGFAIPSYGSNAHRSVVADLVVAGEELGFASAWVPDHIAVPTYAEGVMHPPFLEPLTTCAGSLGFTKRISLGTDVLVAPYRNALLASAIVNTIGLLEPERLVLGVGIGYLVGEFDVMGVDYDKRAATTEEFLRLYRNPPLEFSTIDAPQRPPVWVGGNNSKALSRAALFGDGWHPLWLSPERYANARRQIVETRTAAGLDSPFTFSFSARFTQFAESSDDWPRPTPRAPMGSEFRYAPDPWIEPDGRPGLVGTPTT
jgi:alkanesulfonate monooxygenase SsuD/methylene tetrahydromethanopterin reductase-like flavin-dependent oxidoreductase (luciferase family)